MLVAFVCVFSCVSCVGLLYVRLRVVVWLLLASCALVVACHESMVVCWLGDCCLLVVECWLVVRCWLVA